MCDKNRPFLADSIVHYSRYRYKRLLSPYTLDPQAYKYMREVQHDRPKQSSLKNKRIIHFLFYVLETFINMAFKGVCGGSEVVVRC